MPSDTVSGTGAVISISSTSVFLPSVFSPALYPIPKTAPALSAPFVCPITESAELSTLLSDADTLDTIFSALSVLPKLLPSPDIFPNSFLPFDLLPENPAICNASCSSIRSAAPSSSSILACFISALPFFIIFPTFASPPIAPLPALAMPLAANIALIAESTPEPALERPRKFFAIRLAGIIMAHNAILISPASLKNVLKIIGSHNKITSITGVANMENAFSTHVIKASFL